MKKFRNELKFLEQIREIPNVSLVCEKLRLSRNTIYRWRKEDPTFAESMDSAIADGIESINDLAESKLISNINKGSMRAIEYWLDNNKKNYARPRPKDFWESIKSDNRITEVKISVVNPQGSDRDIPTDT